jgi:hypothetical protein
VIPFQLIFQTKYFEKGELERCFATEVAELIPDNSILILGQHSQKVPNWSFTVNW